jgi:hypothetical protein
MSALWFHGNWTHWNVENVAISVALLGVFVIFQLLRKG